MVSNLLYLASYWHSLAKLRRRTKTTSKVLDDVTVLFSWALRYFCEVTCAAFDTEDTDWEYDARRRAHNRRQQKSGNCARASASFGGKQKRSFNLGTYKLHSLGDYGDYICRFGTTDSYSTQIVSVYMAMRFK